MIDLIHALRTHGGYVRRVCALVPALITAEIFYKFHSFTCECVAFLGTWLLFDLIVETFMRSVRGLFRLRVLESRTPARRPVEQ
jgi:hypothetical protein